MADGKPAPMSRPWFRMYHEVLHDPKVQRLDGDTFKAWVNLLCLACQNDGFLPSIADVAFALRVTVDDAGALLERLRSATLLDKVSGGLDGYRYAPHGWDKRQYKSDTSTQRVKRYRERQQAVTDTGPEQSQSQSQNQNQNIPPTPQGADGVAELTGEIMRRAKMTAPPVDLVLAERWVAMGVDKQLILETVTRMAAGARGSIRAFRYFDAEICRQHEAKAAAKNAEIDEFRRIARRAGEQ